MVKISYDGSPDEFQGYDEILGVSRRGGRNRALRVLPHTAMSLAQVLLPHLEKRSGGSPMGLPRPTIR
eukprot:231510-Pyramimonas_sp.AAC.1